MNVSEIRRQNARYLAESVGGITALANRMNKAQQQITHIIGKNPIKNIGHGVAKQFEAAFDKESGWMDHEHPELWGGENVINDASLPAENYIELRKTPDPLAGLTDLQRELILRMNSLSEKQQLELLKTAEEQAEKNEEFLADYLKRNRVA